MTADNPRARWAFRNDGSVNLQHQPDEATARLRAAAAAAATGRMAILYLDNGSGSFRPVAAIDPPAGTPSGIYDVDTDEMTAGALAALAAVRAEVAAGGHVAAVQIIDRYAADLVQDAAP